MSLKNLSKRLRLIIEPDAGFGDVVYVAGTGFGPRVQADFQLVLVLSGTATVDIDDRSVLVTAGSAILLHPGRREHFHWDREERTHHTWCAVPPEFAVAAGADRWGRGPEIRPITARLAQLMELGLSLAPRAVAATPGLVRALALAAMAEFAASDHTGAPPRIDPARAPLQRVFDWLGQHLAEPIDVNTMARVAGVSRAQLGRIFRTELATTPMHYVWNLRTERGAQLLRDTGLTITEIAEQGGFPNAFHFSRRFRARFGASPRTWRHQQWHQASPS
ncbi:AraC family transcriptional regulator [Synoicihabitans lomoniglobus]|uniref:AraC family transcriptional regulator n=1 Tax=Synoicihabitans lomoniglobus TaxID=2909285 RepID=A0AAE9ZYH4_9BACT|nr:AraC family transcriptional regulator [Opitutaceae bacterium LMO-M01]WED65380.1 AraC family transcriptional regulator [Opitutaceae bacterium LMO-M01]